MLLSMPRRCLVNYVFLTVAAICLHHMQMMKLMFSNSLKCALSHNICHYLIFGRRHIENLIQKNDVKNALKPEVLIH